MTGENPRFMFTARLELRYRKNVPVGQPLQLVGRALKNKVHAATSHGAIYNGEGELLAEAEALLVNIPADMFTSENAKLLGWRDYEE